MSKVRLDILIFERGLASSRERAKTLIMEGRVFVNGQREDKPGSSFDPEKIKNMEVKGDELPYVSRGGLKLEKALKVFDTDVRDKVCLDIGASTGGFTDVMLQNGAAKVYAIDSGTNQLSWKLRSDPRVVCMEKTNFRYVTPDMLQEKTGFAAADASFISLTKLLKPARDLMSDGADMVCLIKPQFEAGRDKVGKHGVVKDKKVHLEVINSVAEFAADTGFFIKGMDFSPITGPEGNIEYLLWLEKASESGEYSDDMKTLAEKTVERAHGELAR